MGLNVDQITIMTDMKSARIEEDGEEAKTSTRKYMRLVFAERMVLLRAKIRAKAGAKVEAEAIIVVEAGREAAAEVKAAATVEVEAEVAARAEITAVKIPTVEVEVAAGAKVKVKALQEASKDILVVSLTVQNGTPTQGVHEMKTWSSCGV